MKHRNLLLPFLPTDPGVPNPDKLVSSRSLGTVNTQAVTSPLKLLAALAIVGTLSVASAQGTWTKTQNYLPGNYTPPAIVVIQSGSSKIFSMSVGYSRLWSSGRIYDYGLPLAYGGDQLNVSGIQGSAEAWSFTPDHLPGTPE